MTNKSILVLEENSVVHGLIASALDVDGLTLHHEFNPAKYVDRARSLKPDLILVSNADQFNNYSICRQLKTGPSSAASLVLLANSKDKLDDNRLRDLKVDGVVRKPFEASDLQAQVSRHLRMPDLVGAAYEYRQSQSSREQAYDPLAQMDVLDDETVTMMKATGTTRGGMPVPEVDFSAELSHEVTSTETVTTTTTRSEMRSSASETRLAGTQATLPVSDFDDSDLDDMAPAEADSLLAPSTFEQEDLAAPFPSMRAGEDADFEELGMEDLLDDETLEEAGQLVMDADITETRIDAPATLQPSPLDKIDVELSASDLLVQQAADLEPEPDDMTLFQQEFEPNAAAKPVDETIPLAVRRMMEQKPVFTPPERTSVTESVRTETVETRTTTESVRSGTSLPQRGEWPKPEAMKSAVDELDDLHDIDLGEDQLDEEEILSAMESEPMVQMDDVEGLDDDDLLALSMEEEEQLSAVPEPSAAEMELSAPEEDDEEISIDEDEEELILSSLEEEEAGDVALQPRASSLDLTSTERSGLNEILSAQEETVLDATTGEADFDLMDLEMPAQEATPREIITPFPTDEVLEVPPDDLLVEEVHTDTVTTTTTETTTTRTETVAQTKVEAPDVAIEFGSDDLQADLFSETDLGSVGDDLTDVALDAAADPFPELSDTLPVLDSEEVVDFKAETLATAESKDDLFGMGDDMLPPLDSEPMAEMESETILDPQPQAFHAPEAESSDDGGDSDFEDAFAALRNEIQSNPEGERLDDVLRLEGIQNKIGRLDFTIPQHESPFARGMGMYAMADGGAVAEPKRAAVATAQAATVSASSSRVEQQARRESTTVTTEQVRSTTIETRLTQALDGQALTGSLLDEATKARLSQVLDEIISISVRKAVREEMPRLMQRLAKDSPQA